MPALLTSAQSAAIAAAQALLRRGDANRAVATLVPQIRSGGRSLPLLLAYADACERAGMLDEVAGALKLAISQEPGSAELWLRLGVVAEEMGQSDQAVSILERASELGPENEAAWYNLGVAAISAGQYERAIKALTTALELLPANAAAYAALGLAQQQTGALDLSEANLRHALELDPSLLSTVHNLAVTLRLLDRSAEALLLIDHGINRGLQAPMSKLIRAHLLADVGNFDEAIPAYRAIVRANPDMLDAHDSLARMLPQLGSAGDALASFGEALERAPSEQLYRAALKAAFDLKRPEMLERWAADFTRQFGDQPDVQLMRALALGISGDSAKALINLEQLISGGFTPALAQGAYHSLKMGDLERAERHALAATRADFQDQSAWACLSLIWRLRDDARERWLADYDRFVMARFIDPPAGDGGLDEFMSGVALELDQLHLTSEHPADQSLRLGTQTRGNLFDKRLPFVQKLVSSIQRSIGQAVSTLPFDKDHPFLSRNTGSSRFLGSWSVRLRGGGFHVSHIHQNGWLSSALYIALPAQFTETGQSEVSPGSLTFGIPPRDLGLDLPPRRVEVPKVGKLVLFPSYFWHSTAPFESPDHRLTVAFDAAPA